MTISKCTAKGQSAVITGLRVIVSINSESHRKHFSYIKKSASRDRPTVFHSAKDIAGIKQEAEALNDKWTAEQRKFQKIRNTYGKPHIGPDHKQWDTGVRGLTCLYRVSDRRVANPHVVFAICIFSTDDGGKRVQVFRHIPDENQVKQEWRKMARLLADARGITRIPANWITSMPDDEQRAAMKRKATKFYFG